MKTPEILKRIPVPERIKKIPRLLLILVPVIIVLAVVNYFLAMGYLDASSTVADLEKQINQRELAIAGIEGRYNIGELQGQLAEAERKIEEESPFPNEVDNEEVIELFIRVQREAGLEIPYSESGVGTTTIGGRSYHTKTYSISPCENQVLSRLINFLEILENEQYNTLKNDNISLRGPDEWSLTFTMTIVYR